MLQLPPGAELEHVTEYSVVLKGLTTALPELKVLDEKVGVQLSADGADQVNVTLSPGFTFVSLAVNSIAGVPCVAFVVLEKTKKEIRKVSTKNILGIICMNLSLLNVI